jgi:hypothetical protein
MKDEEIWMEILNYEGYYQVSNLGNIKALERSYLNKGKYLAVRKEMLLTPVVNSHGYYVVTLCKKSKYKCFRIHQLVAQSFLNHILQGSTTYNVVDHINNNKLDNRLENLQIVSNRINTSKNKQNKTSKYTGVSWRNKSQKWVSYIRDGNKTLFLGEYVNEDDAYNAYCEKLKCLEK